ncbi:MAG: glycosyltransferase family 4 protein [Verrucomicrobia bacterium]|nr:glycosyltransferase family 4 protein [Verrucomicrobiota bacterium]
MKIAMVVPDNRDEFHRWDQAEPEFGPAPSALLEGLASRSDCEVHVVSCTHRPMRAPAKLAPNVSFRLVEVGSWGWMRGGYIGCVTAVRRVLRAIRPDIVHGQGTERYCALAAGWSGFPNLVTVHGNMRAIARVHRARPLSFQWLTARLESIALRRTHGVVCLTRHTEHQVARLARRMWCVPNAVDRSFFDVVPSPRERPLVLCVATISHLKNSARLLGALDPLAAEHAFELVCLGFAPGRDPYVKEFFRLLQARPWARHAGYATRPQLQAFLREASVLVLPSIEDNCPMAVLEAMAAGVPVAASTAGGIPELVEPEVTGLLFDPLDERAMAGAVRRLIVDRAMARQLALTARERARRLFSPDLVAARHMEIYREAMDATRVRPGA